MLIENRWFLRRRPTGSVLVIGACALVTGLLVAPAPPPAAATPGVGDTSAVGTSATDLTTRLTGRLVVLERANIRDDGSEVVVPAATTGHAGHTGHTGHPDRVGTGGVSPTQGAALQIGSDLVPLDSAVLARGGAGDRISVTVAVPAAVVAAVPEGSITVPSPGGTDELPLDAAEAAAAVRAPAPATSTLARATTAVAAAAGRELTTSDVQVVAPAPVARVAARHEFFVAVAGYQGTNDPRYTDAAVTDLVTRAGAYWTQQTEGAQTFSLRTVVRYDSTTACSSGPWAQWAEAAAATGFSWGANQHLVVLYPPVAGNQGCSYGLGTVGWGPTAGGASYVVDLNWSALAHEVGHNLSLGHANTLTCLADASQDPGNASFAAGYTDGRAAGCGEHEYGDLMDVMSSSGNRFGVGGTTARSLRRLGVLGTAGGSAVDVVDPGVTHWTLNALSSQTGLRSVGITDPRNGNRYYVENRQPVGTDAAGWNGGGPGSMQFGVRVVKDSPLLGGTLLLDPTPDANPWAWWDTDKTVAPGSTWTSAGGGVQVRTTSGTGGQVVLDVSVAPAGSTHWAAQRTTTTLGPLPAMTAGASATLSGTVTAAAGTVAPSGSVTVAVGPASTTATLVPGTGRSSTFSARLVAPAAGRHTVTTSYAATGSFAASTASSAVTVAAARAATTTVVNAPGVLRRGVPAVITGTVSSAAGTPTGTVTVTVGGVSVRTASTDGTWTVSLTPATSGATTLTAAYAETARFRWSSTSRQVTVQKNP